MLNWVLRVEMCAFLTGSWVSLSTCQVIYAWSLFIDMINKKKELFNRCFQCGQGLAYTERCSDEEGGAYAERDFLLTHRYLLYHPLKKSQ